MKHKYKITVYTICKNEKKFINRWLDSIVDADYICVLDTGSTDGTYEEFQRIAATDPRFTGGKLIVKQKIYGPGEWRFDVARNDNMAFIPEDSDIDFSIDLDEVASQGWRRTIEKNWTPETDIGWYMYAWSHIDNSPDKPAAREFWYNKMTKHKGNHWSWQFPVHENLCYDRATTELKDIPHVSTTISTEALVHHYPDQSKSRSSYLSLLELRFKEDPKDLLTMIYLSHEYYFQDYYDKCIEFSINHTLPRIEEYYASDESLRTADPLFLPDIETFIADSYLRLKKYEEAVDHYNKAINANGGIMREPYTHLAELLLSGELAMGNEELKKQLVMQAINLITRMLIKTQRHYNWLETDICWGYHPYDILSRCYFELGKYDVSLSMVKAALELCPGDQRLIGNMNCIKSYYDKRE